MRYFEFVNRLWGTQLWPLAINFQKKLLEDR